MFCIKTLGLWKVLWIEDRVIGFAKEDIIAIEVFEE